MQAAEVGALPQILGQPQVQVIIPGDTASFSVAAVDSTGLSYQWCFYGTNLPGATSDTLSITNVSILNQGPYTVILSNPSGSVTSAPAMLWIDSRGCGMPDSWQMAYFGNFTNNATGDYDHDGVSNLQEFLDGTNPTNSASARYRLTVLNSGGSVQVSPLQLSYTNGQSVTLTASAFVPYSFRGWSGDVVSTNNPITLAMTTNKTVFAFLGPASMIWTNAAGGDWNTASNWSPNLVPGIYDAAIIDASVSVTLTNDADCDSLTLGGPNSNPTLSGGGVLTLHGSSTWNAGTMSGSGRTVIGPGAALTIPGSFSVTLSSRTLENGGTVIWTGGGSLNLTSAVITNRPGSLFDVENTISFSGSGSRFDNAGTFRKSVNSGTVTVSSAFNNYGIIDLQIGTLQWNGSFANNGTVNLAASTTNVLSSGGSATGTFTTPATALVEWTGTPLTAAFALNPGAQLTGDGLYRLDGATVGFNTNVTVQNLSLVATASGTSTTLNGSGNVTVNNTMNWSSGTLSGGGQMLIAAGATLNVSNSSSVTLSGRTLENDGTVIWTGGGGLNLTSAVITNRSGSLFDVENTISLTGSGSRFDNAGTFRKSVNSGTVTVNSAFNNYGIIDLQVGTLQWNGSFVNNGTVNLAASTTNVLSSGGSATGTFTTPATALVEWTGTPLTAAFALNPGAQLTGDGLYRLDGATVGFNTNVTVQNLSLVATVGGTSTTLNGSGNVTVSNTMNWSSATISGGGQMLIAAGATLSMSNSSSIALSGRTLANGGTVIWTGGGSLNLSSAVITNWPGSLFDVENTPSIAGSGSRFDNAGTFRKSINTNVMSINTVPFNNFGTVDVRSGTLAPGNGYTSSSSAFLNCALGGTNAASDYGRLQVAGAVTLNGGLSVDLANGFVPSTNDTFVLLTAGTRAGAFANFVYPSNLVTMQLSNTPTSVVVRVIGVAPPRPSLLTPAVSGSNVLLTWTAVSNSVYRLEFNPDLGSSNWSPLSGDVTSSGNTASKLDPLAPSNRFYRVRLIP